jgi:hypothetical protein
MSFILGAVEPDAPASEFEYDEIYMKTTNKKRKKLKDDDGATKKRPSPPRSNKEEEETKQQEEEEEKKKKTDATTVLGNLPVPLPPPEGFEPNFLASLNSHPLDATVKFDEESHTYWIQFVRPDGLKEFQSSKVVSVSGFVHHQYFGEFDADAIITKMTSSKKWGKSKYNGMTPEEIKDLWTANGNAASAAGTAFHFIAECLANGYTGIPNNPVYMARPEIRQLLKFWKEEVIDKGFVPFRTELRYRSDASLRLCGTSDLLLIKADHPPPKDTDGVLTLHCADWKNSKSIKFSNYFQKGTGICSGLDDCNFSHYLLQQNAYKFLHETFYPEWTWRNQKYTSVNIATMRLVVCHANYGDSALLVDIPDTQDLIRAMVAERREALLSKDKA